MFEYKIGIKKMNAKQMTMEGTGDGEEVKE